MIITIEVKRERPSATQGYVHIYINGDRVHSFADNIELITDKNKTIYGENIGGWASVTPDGDFIVGFLYHPYDKVYHISDLFKAAIKKADEPAKK
jgi:hypothetical protein